MSRNRDNFIPFDFVNRTQHPYPTANYPSHRSFNFPQKIENLGNNDINIPEYGISQKHLIPSDYEKPNLLHNNVTEKVSIENLVEYTIVIDSGDRDYSKFPNPFDYRVYFNPPSGTKDAYIHRSFENVKYIKLETGILPRKYSISRTSFTPSATNRTTLLNSGTLRASNVTFNLIDDLSGNHTIIEDYILSNMRTITFGVTKTYPELIDTTYEVKYDLSLSAVSSAYKFTLNTESLENDKFILLKIDEYQDVNEMATNLEVSRSFSMMFPDFVNGDYFYTDTHYVDKIFRFSSLGNIKNFTIKLQDSKGNQLTPCPSSFIDSHVPVNNDIKDTRDANGVVIRDYRAKTNYIRHPLFEKFQNILMFKIGVVENDIDRAIFV
jgi:hypothetical protein